MLLLKRLEKYLRVVKSGREADRRQVAYLMWIISRTNPKIGLGDTPYRFLNGDATIAELENTIKDTIKNIKRIP